MSHDPIKYLDERCDAIDASVFNGDLLFDDAQRNMLKQYIKRWSKTIKDHEDGKPAPFVQQMIEDCLPGGSSCDPQQVADAIRAWAKARGLE